MRNESGEGGSPCGFVTCPTSKAPVSIVRAEGREGGQSRPEVKRGVSRETEDDRESRRGKQDDTAAA